MKKDYFTGLWKAYENNLYYLLHVEAIESGTGAGNQMALKSNAPLISKKLVN